MSIRGLIPLVGGMAAVCAMLLGGTPKSFGQTVSKASGPWHDANTWTNGVPSDTSSATINGGDTVTISQSGAVTNLLDVGTANGETGTINMTSGDLTIFDTDTTTEPNTSMIRLGAVTGSTGIFTMSGGDIFISDDGDGLNEFNDGDLTIGAFGTGTATVNGGSITATDELFLAQDSGGVGTLNVGGTGVINVTGRNLQVGFAFPNEELSLPGGQGTLNVSGSAQVNVQDTIFVAFGDANAGASLAGAHGEVNISDSATVNVNGWMQTSFGLGTTSVINQSGGTLNISGLLVHAARGQSVFNHTGGAVNAQLVIIGDGVGDTPSDGTYNISGAGTTMKSNAIFWVGAWANSHGVVNHNGGTIDAGALTVGRDGTGEYNMSAGTLIVQGNDIAPANNHLIVGQVGDEANFLKGTGVFTQTGGTVTAKTGVFLGDYNHSEGTYKISGGTLNVDGTGDHEPDDVAEESFIGDFSVGGALASNAPLSRVEPDGTNGPQGQALAAKGTLIVSGSGATINIARHFLANPADKSEYRREPHEAGGDNSATLVFEIFDNTGVSRINVGGVADLDGAVIDMDLMGGFTPAVNTTFDLLRASSFGATGTGTTQNVGTGMGFTLAGEDTGGWSLAVVPDGGFSTLRATFLGAVGQPGDFDGDGDVDGRDFLVWQRGNSPNPLSSGDLSLWQANYGAGGLAAIGSVPEPTSIALLGMLGVCAFAARGRNAAR